VLSGRGLCDKLITCPEESYRPWRVVCDHETSNEEAKARYGAVENTTKRVVTPRKQKTTTNNHSVNVILALLRCYIVLTGSSVTDILDQPINPETLVTKTA